MGLPTSVKIVEVGARDGLQNEATMLPTETKIEFINQLSQTGLKAIEATSFVSPKRIPQLADNSDVLKGIKQAIGVSYPVLVPNMKGFDNALEAGATEICVFAAASETFAQKNTNCSIAESLERITAVIEASRKHNIKVRGYISCVLGCPYEGEISPKKVAELANTLYNLGCVEISLGDTIGIGNPTATQALIKAVTEYVPIDKIAGHFHDTYDRGLANILAALQLGVSVFDCSVAGLGGCPYAKGATGNVATEDVVAMLEDMGIETGVDLDRLIATGKFICEYLGKKTNSKVAAASGL